jgi:hypothetical protein
VYFVSVYLRHRQGQPSHTGTVHGRGKENVNMLYNDIPQNTRREGQLRLTRKLNKLHGSRSRR